MNGQVGVFNLVLKEQTTKKYFDEKVKEQVMSFIVQLPEKTKESKVPDAV